jgi:hypothetical protein
VKVRNYKKILNVFCPTGEGGGIDPSCSPGESASVPVESGEIPEELKSLTKELTEQFDSYKDKLTDGEKKAIISYTGIGYADMNEEMRASAPYNFKTLPMYVEEKCNNLMSAIDKAGLLPHSVEAFRGLSVEDPHKLDAFEKMLKDGVASGQPVSMPQFTSVSLDHEYMEHHFLSKVQDNHGAYLHIIAKSGLYAGKITTMAGNAPREQEIIQSPHTKYKVNKAERDTKGMLRVELEEV